MLEEGIVLAHRADGHRQSDHAVRMGDDHWAIFSQDGSLAAHFEFTVAVTPEGPRILTPWHADGPGPNGNSQAASEQRSGRRIGLC